MLDSNWRNESSSSLRLIFLQVFFRLNLFHRVDSSQSTDDEDLVKTQRADSMTLSSQLLYIVCTYLAFLFIQIKNELLIFYNLDEFLHKQKICKMFQYLLLTIRYQRWVM